MTTPTLEDFARRSNWAIEFAATIEPNVPVLAPLKNTTENRAVTVRKAALRLGKKLTLRTFDGQVWACWIVPSGEGGPR